MDSLKAAFLHERRKLAVKLQNPRLLNVGFHTLRHWKATMLYHKTTDPFYVKDFLGHTSMKNTEKYVNIERKMFAEYANDEFTVKIAQSPQELTVLFEVGFEYVCQKDTLIFLRKRKMIKLSIYRGKPKSMEKCAEVAHFCFNWRYLPPFSFFRSIQHLSFRWLLVSLIESTLKLQFSPIFKSITVNSEITVCS